MKKKKIAFGKILVLVVVLGVFSGWLSGAGYCLYIYNSRNTGSTENEKAEEIGDITDVPQIEKTLPPVTAEDVSAVVEAVMPAIVSISAEVTAIQYDIFGRAVEYPTVSAGSGIIIGQNSDELLIVTNEHVVSDASTVVVTFCDEKQAEAVVKGSDANADLAVICIDMERLEASTKKQIRIANLGDSKQLKAGSMTIAIGNALGYGQSTTVGYVSALDREVTVNDVERVLIQTDAAINPGNSGGALLNTNGEVIGINSVKYASEEVEGMGYAIPISDAVPIINELMNREQLTEKEAGYLGISGQTVTSSYSAKFGIPVGVYVNEISEGSPAEQAGMRRGDIIVKINQRTISTAEDLYIILDTTRAGTEITITVKTLQNNEYVEKDYRVTLGNR